MTSNACQTGVTVSDNHSSPFLDRFLEGDWPDSWHTQRENATFVTTARQIGARNVHPFSLVLAAPAATDCARRTAPRARVSDVLKSMVSSTNLRSDLNQINEYSRQVKDDSLVTPGLDTVLSIQDGQHACVPELAKTK
ncbi:uncharacterized protein VDAG_06200 [Verticillium dahliae VdLs.17]|uniref:Uncharacterized protein n=1 Tax=Verticillium dahliae (strain VdLs.17 / ATCC MYA-4575 / FGSC 10137) TaxID=498257 RepID=G2X8Q9_VERDV|nr:uncharacterized protein VDAG_06200 [Verticillium dahliae VdLs.17]EGY15346.1 hypothetical protein VDAG_06200 [Verticillium dahliae VdLs.17]KAH6697997.1 hypothetical protein EV126DRAFT_426532 [Verticillium dahliae]